MGSSLQTDALDSDFIIRSTGERGLDAALGQALVRLRQFFDVSPGVGLYDDYPPNALAYAETFVPGTKGTVVLGQELMRRQMATYQDGGISVIAIVAHEFGHVLQNDVQILDQLTLPQGQKKLVELHADFMAGLYISSLSKEPKVPLYDIGRTFEKLGDTDFTNRDHHGTPKERTAAIQFGFEVGIKHAKLTPRQAIDESVSYIKETFSR
jgi:hypothetical protein